MSFPELDRRRLDTLHALARVDPMQYARARLGTMIDDPVVREAVWSRIRAGWEPLAAIDEASHRAYRRMCDLALARLEPGNTILDFGAGRGSFGNFERDYLAVPHSIVAVDKVAPPQPFPPHVRFIQSDLHAFEWDGPPFDLALALHMFEQVPDTPRLAAHLRSFLRTGGHALVAIPDGRFVHDLVKWIYKQEECDEVNVYTQESFDMILSAAGFQLESWTCWPSYFTMHFGHVPLPGGRSLGELLERLAREFDHANGTQAFSCYGYALDYVAR